MKNLDELVEKFKPSFEIVIETTVPEILIILKDKCPQYEYSLDTDPNAGFVLDPADYSAVKEAIKYNNRYAIAYRPQKATLANWTTYRRIVQFDIELKAKHNEAHPENQVERIIGCTVNKRKELRCLYRLGVDGIQTDYPKRLKRISEGRRIPFIKRKFASPLMLQKQARS
jgi:hypothetical protein